MMSALQRELNAFFSKVLSSDYTIQAVTKGALTQARAKLKPEAFLELNQKGLDEFYSGAPYLIWKTHRILAIDGSTINLPSHKSTFEEFGKYGVGCNGDVERSMARISICYDVLNLLTLDARIDRFDSSEQALLKNHLEHASFQKDDLLLLDRGYPSIALMYTLQQRGMQFCMRMKDSWWKEVEAFRQSGLQSKEVMFELPKKDLHLQQEFGSTSTSVRCRLVAITLDNGQIEILCTSLLDQQEYTIEELKDLYHARWNVEEAYKLLKCRAQLEAFSGKTAVSVKQDFYAKIFMMTMCALLSFPIEEKLREEHKHSKNKHPRKVNRTNVLGFLRESWIALWLTNRKKKILEAMDFTLFKTADIVRKGRSFPRKKSSKKPPPANYKQL